MVVLSIDHGARSGYSVFEDNEYVESGVVTLDSVTSLRQAQVEFYQIFSFYKPKRYSPSPELYKVTPLIVSYKQGLLSLSKHGIKLYSHKHL